MFVCQHDVLFIYMLWCIIIINKYFDKRRTDVAASKTNPTVARPRRRLTRVNKNFAGPRGEGRGWISLS